MIPIKQFEVNGYNCKLDIRDVDKEPILDSSNIVESNGIATTYGYYTDNPEWIKVITDSTGKIICGIRQDFSIEWSIGVPTPIKNYIDSLNENDILNASIIEIYNELSTLEQNISDTDANLSILNTDITSINSSLNTLESNYQEITEDISTLNEIHEYNDYPEYIHAVVDSSDHIVEFTDSSCMKHFPKQELYEMYDDVEKRTHIILDDDNKIISYRDSSGGIHENVALHLSDSAKEKFINDIKSNDAFVVNNNWSSYNSNDGEIPLNINIPRLAKINIIADNFSIPELLKEGVVNAVEGVNYDVPTYLEFFDMNGNYFKKPIIISAQGQGTLYARKKNLAIDFFDDDTRETAFKIKFGHWVAQDSFHLKSYHNDELHCRSICAYKVYNDIVKSRGVVDDYVWKRHYYQTANTTETSSGFSSSDDFIDCLDNGAQCFPDGFPVVLYVNDKFYGLYVMLLKKHRDNYKLNKKSANHVWLDTVIYDIWNMNGELDWSIFSQTKVDTMTSLRGLEIRNPKDIYCIDFTYSYEILDTSTNEKQRVLNKPQYKDYSGDATLLTDEEIRLQFNDFPPAYLYDSSTDIMYRIKQNPTGECVKYNFDNPNKRSELIDETMSCYDPTNENHIRTNKVKQNMIELSKIYPSLQELDSQYTNNKSEENLIAFKTKFEQHFDINNLIDYQIICQLTYHWDNWGNNWLWFTYDSVKWYVGLYDCDATWGIGNSNNMFSPMTTFIGQKMFTMLTKYYKDELCERYQFLRQNNIIDRNNIIKHFQQFMNNWGTEYYELEFNKWSQTSIRDSLLRIIKWIDKCIEEMDILYTK